MLWQDKNDKRTRPVVNVIVRCLSCCLTCTIGLSVTIQLVETCSHIEWYNIIQRVVSLASIAILWLVCTQRSIYDKKQNRKKIIYFHFLETFRKASSLSLTSLAGIYNLIFILGSWILYFLSLMLWEWTQKQVHSDVHYWNVKWHPHCEYDNWTVFFY